MATLTFYVPTDMRTFAGYNFSTIQGGGGGGSTGATDYRWDFNSGFHYDIYGTMLSGGFYAPADGTVTGWELGFRDRYYNPADPFSPIIVDRTYWTFSDLNVVTADFAMAIQGDGASLAGYMPTMLAGNDSITGSAFNDALLGYAGNDSILGGGGDDFLNGGADDDTLNGGPGSDTLAGGGGTDVLIGGSGADIMRGNGGDDTYFVDDAGDRALELMGDGTDTVRATVTHTLRPNVENLVLIGSDAINGVGNELANQITGNEAANVLSGRDGNDVLTGAGGNDRLVGGNGADSLIGGAGDDWLEGGADQDVMAGGAGGDLFVFRDGDFSGATPVSADRILDFSQADGDRIRLDYVDANSANGAATNEAFTFIGTSGFHHVAGELRYEQMGPNTYLFGDTDGDGIADFAIRVDGLHTFVIGDFVL